MRTTVLPSTHRESSAEEMERETADWEPGDEVTAGGKISATTLSRTAQCLLCGLWASHGEKGIGPSPFTQATLDDGNAYEDALFGGDNKEIWIQAINQALGTVFLDDLPLVRGTELKRRADESPAVFVKRAAEEFAKSLPSLAAPFALTWITLASDEPGALILGHPDLLLWTGDAWIICDIKCSEEARRTHGIQISAYARMLKSMRPDDEIHSSGVVIHCASGYRYTADSSPTDKSTTLTHTQATPFPLAALDPVVTDFINFLAAPREASLARAMKEAVFSSVCNECEFRLRCYPRFLEAKHVSLLPIMKAELDAIMDSGITTIPGVIAAIKAPGSEAYQTLLELKDDSPIQLRFLLQKAEQVLRCGLYSSWCAHKPSLENPLFFVSVDKEYLFEPLLTVNSNFTCLVVYAEGERRLAWGKMLALKAAWRIPTYILSKEIQQTVHGPLPSITLRPLAEVLSSTTTYEGFQEFYSSSETAGPQHFEGQFQEKATPAERLIQLQIVWNFLLTSAIPFTLEPAPGPA